MKKAVWIVAGATLALSGCGLIGKDEHGYPEIVKRNFITSCTTKSSEADCTCALAGIEKVIGYDKFQEADAAARADKPVDPVFQRQVESIVMQCRGGK
jgi:hypothetical protein